MHRLHAAFIFALLGAAVPAGAQTKLDDAGLAAWKAGNADFIAFDIRGDAVIESVAYPCFRTFSPAAQLRYLGCTPRILVYCHGGDAARTAAAAVIDSGYPADSVFYAGFDSLPGSRYPASDTLPLAFLHPVDTVPQNLSAHQLRVLMVSRNTIRLVDVRSESEIAATGVIKGACNLVWTDPFQSSLGRFGHDETVIINCRSGARAGSARSYMISEGFDPSKVINFGGFSKYADAGVGPVSMTPTDDCSCSGIGDAVLAQRHNRILNGIRLAPTVTVRGKTLRLAGTADGIRWRVYDTHGIALTPESGGTAVRTDGLGAGTYLLRITGDDGASKILTFIIR